MELICEIRLCTGCAACSEVCPQSAVVMVPNDEGFLCPQINAELCNDCGLCRKTCPVNEAAKDVDPQHMVYACFSKDENTRSKSSSGGVFSQLARSVLINNGVVFGAGFDEAFRVRHSFIEKEEELDGLRRSKYVQSDTGRTFIEARSFLKEGKKVLFCGTPCQIAGLKAFLNREYENLLTCDLACHGVPSPKVWDMYLDFIRGKYKSSIAAVSFRDKSTGWNNSCMKINFKDGSQYIDLVKKETFFIGFGKSVFNRSSCYECKFRIRNTKADITLADFWGIDKQNDSDFNDNRGVSLVITHTAAGQKALLQINEEICMKQRTLDEAVKYNPRLVSSVEEPSGRKSFFNDMRVGYGFDRLRKKYMDNFSIKYRIKCLLKLILGKV